MSLLSDTIKELTILSEKGKLTLLKIELWLLKYAEYYKNVKYNIDNIPKEYIFPRINKLYKDDFNFADLFELLDKVIICHRNENYFEYKLQEYDNIKNNSELLDEWLKVQYQDLEKNKSKFDDLFYDNREQTDYSFKLKTSLNINLNPNEFKYSLKYCRLLKKSKMILLTGKVKWLGELESFEEERKKEDGFVNIRPAFKRRLITIDAEDEDCNHYTIRFINGKTELLNEVELNHKLNIFIELRGYQDIEGSKRNKYKTSLFGWDVKQVNN